jgi:hypothetical protein
MFPISINYDDQHSAVMSHPTITVAEHVPNGNVLWQPEDIIFHPYDFKATGEDNLRTVKGLPHQRMNAGALAFLVGFDWRYRDQLLNSEFTKTGWWILWFMGTVFECKEEEKTIRLVLCLYQEGPSHWKWISHRLDEEPRTKKNHYIALFK